MHKNSLLLAILLTLGTLSTETQTFFVSKWPDKASLVNASMSDLVVDSLEAGAVVGFASLIAFYFFYCEQGYPARTNEEAEETVVKPAILSASAFALGAFIGSSVNRAFAKEYYKGIARGLAGYKD